MKNDNNNKKIDAAFDWPCSEIKYKGLILKITSERILVLSEYKRYLQHHFPTKRYINI